MTEEEPYLFCGRRTILCIGSYQIPNAVTRRETRTWWARGSWLPNTRDKTECAKDKMGRLLGRLPVITAVDARSAVSITQIRAGARTQPLRRDLLTPLYKDKINILRMVILCEFKVDKYTVKQTLRK